ncbi:hypothetical protein GA0061099_1011129 [Bradyrhizobium yuanmingense]|uniref:Uncharacterized protein n=1 Tax=Bradyrhizobium yuanmingense TaxID=108015 RepID=A0A1C3XBK8_9BRAD|nr:hypothetical protein IQ15_06412 [Bradyrhizobium yuanmingense]SCB49670.1 hypothetical protein GA0061099_1011129 [Bradyrhizobium yuanmingense]
MGEAGPRAGIQATSGPERDALLKKARQADVANHLNDWVKSPGLQPPE